MHKSDAADLFSGCPEYIKDQLVYQHVKKGEILSLQELKEEYVYIILEGSVKVYNLFPDGSTCQINVFRPIDFIGEMEVFIEGGSLHMAEVNEDSYIAKLTKEAFLDWVHSDTNLCFMLLQHTQTRLFDLGKRLMLLRQLSSTERLHISLHYSSGTINKQDLQDEIAVSARTLNRLLQQESDAGTLRVENGVVHILNPDVIAETARRYDNLIPASMRNRN